MLRNTKVVVAGLVAAGSVLAAGPAWAGSPFADECEAGGGVLSRAGASQSCRTTTVVEDDTDVSRHSVLETTTTGSAQKYIASFVHQTTTTTTTVATRRGKTRRTMSSGEVTGRRNAEEQCVRAVFTVSAGILVPQDEEAVDIQECASRGLFDWPLAWGS